MSTNKAMTECRNCKHRRTIPWDAHIQCANPDPNMKGSKHGVKMGWFAYPYNFDPVWKEKECSNFEPLP